MEGKVSFFLHLEDGQWGWNNWSQAQADLKDIWNGPRQGQGKKRPWDQEKGRVHGGHAPGIYKLVLEEAWRWSGCIRLSGSGNGKTISGIWKHPGQEMRSRGWDYDRLALSSSYQKMPSTGVFSDQAFFKMSCVPTRRKMNVSSSICKVRR